jgi:hypothetical protein
MKDYKEKVNDTKELVYTYKLMKGADNELYVTVKPLMNDIQNSMEKMLEIDTTELSKENKQLFDLKLLGLKTVYEFLGALVTEQTLKDKAVELRGDIPLNTESNFTVTGMSPTKH